MPSERKESPTSERSAGSQESTVVSADGSSDADSPAKQGKGKTGGRAQPKSSSNVTEEAAERRKGTLTVRKDSGGSPDTGRHLPGVRRAFRNAESPDSGSRSLQGGRRVMSSSADMSHLSVSSVGTGSKGSYGSTDLSSSRLTIRPEVEIRFPGALPKDHECPVCGLVLRYPVLFDCGHRCCSSCLSDLLRVSPRCPIDQTKVERDQVFVDKNFQKILDELAVLCSNCEKGCPWSEKLKDLASHLSECAFTTVSCPHHCEARFERRFEEQHLADDCPRRPVICPFCELMVTADIEADHREECHRFLVPCPNGCKHKEIPREEVPIHMETKCGKQRVTCAFLELGCRHECERKQLSAHNKASAESHLTLVGESLAQWKRAFDTQTELLHQLTEKLVNAECRLEALGKLYGSQLVWRITDYAQKLDDARKAKTTTIYSPEFYAHRNGHKMIASACLNGDGKARGKHMSVFLSICRGEYDSLIAWPFNYRVTFTLVDQCQNPAARRDITYSIKPNICKENKTFLGRPTTDRNASFGAQRFAELAVLETCDYLRDDCMFIKIVIDNEEVEGPAT